MIIDQIIEFQVRAVSGTGIGEPPECSDSPAVEFAADAVLQSLLAGQSGCVGCARFTLVDHSAICSGRRLPHAFPSLPETFLRYSSFGS